jgi:hypothetical protein
MLAPVRYVRSIFLLSIFLLTASWHAETAEKNMIVFGHATANLHAEPGVEHPLEPTMINADRVAAEELAWKQYIIVVADSRNEPVHIKFLNFVNEAGAQTSDPDSTTSKTPTTESKEPTKKADSTKPAKIPTRPAGKPTVAAPSSKASSATKSMPTLDKSQEEKNPPATSPSILQMLEGHETELIVVVAIAAAFFFIGWICGGNYYLRRDRRRRTKIRF